MKPKKKTKNPSDSTTRNIRAANKRFEELELGYRLLDKRLVEVTNQVYALTLRINSQKRLQERVLDRMLLGEEKKRAKK